MITPAEASKWFVETANEIFPDAKEEVKKQAKEGVKKFYKAVKDGATEYFLMKVKKQSEVLSTR